MAKKHRIRSGVLMLAFSAVAAAGILPACSSSADAPAADPVTTTALPAPTTTTAPSTTAAAPTTAAPPPATTTTTLPTDPNCMENAAAEDGGYVVPALEDDFESMAALPYTGQPVYDVITDADYSITSCIIPTEEMTPDAMGQYWLSDNMLEIGETTSDTGTFFHEDFHAVQDVTGATDPAYNAELTAEDTAVAMLLTEANAEAYAITAYEEAIRFHPEVKATYAPMVNDVDLIGVFNAAFEKSWDANDGASSAARQEKALEAGGQAVSATLLIGGSAQWMNAYAANTVDAVNAIGANGFADGTADGYSSLLTQVFSNIGRVSDDMNMTPEALRNNQAPAAVAEVVKASGLTFTTYG